MTTAAGEPTISRRCTDGQHSRCPGLLPRAMCGCRCGHPATVNVRAASAVVLHDRAQFDSDRMFHAQASELLAMLGLVDGRDIVDDDVRSNNLGGLGGAHQATGGNTDERPLRLVDQDDDDLPRSRLLTTPPGLVTLPPASAPTPTPKPAPKPVAAAKRPAKPRTTPTPAAPRPDTAAAEKARLLAAGVNPDTAAVLTGGRPKAAPDSGRPRPPRQLKPINHGTLTGHTAHVRQKVPIPPDDPCGCRAARHKYDQDRAAAKKAPSAPPPPKPVSAAELLADAQRSPDRAVVRAAASGIRLLVQIQAAPPNRVDRLLTQLADALADVSRAQARAASRTNGAT